MNQATFIPDCASNDSFITAPNNFDPPMLPRRFLLFVASAVVLLGLLARPATAQMSNIDTVEGPSAGEKTTLTITPHSLTDNVSARALGVKAPNSVRFALTLIGVSRTDSLRLTLDGETLPIKQISRPAEGEVGPTRVYLSQKTFLTVAERNGVRLHIGTQTAQIPNQMRKEMQAIFGRVV